MIFGWWKRWRRNRILSEAWPEDWSLHLNRNIRLTWEMTPEEIKKLRDLVQIFIGEKYFEGCKGLKITDEIKVTIAGQACLMLLGVEDFCFDNVPSVLVYPSSFQRQMSDGLSDNVSRRHAGEAWQGGPIVLSWRDALQGGRNEDDARNVVIHEFAHALDGLDGEMGGNLMFDTPELTAEWQEVVEKEFAALKSAEAKGRRTLLNHYGATNHAEFFAVASETFFERPRRLADQYSELFRLLKSYYHLDPRKWVHD